MNNYIDIAYSYFIFNILLALGYLLTRGVLSISNRYLHLGQQQQLQMVKTGFFLLLTSLSLAPFLFSFLITPEISSFQIQPFLKNSATSLLTLEIENKHPYTFPKLENSLNNLLPLILIFAAIITGITYACMRYRNHIQQLRNFIAQSYSYKTIGKLKIVISEQIKVPFCWSWMNKSYICLPYSCLANQHLLKTFIFHEIQHIRQRDPFWQHLLAFINIICFWNPALIFWKILITHLQEYACDEALVVDKKILPIDYTQALLLSAESALDDTPNTFNQWGVIHFLGRKNLSILKTRMEKIFNYQPSRKLTSQLFMLALLLLASFSSLSYAFSNDSPEAITLTKLQTIIEQNHLNDEVNIQANPEILNALNAILSSPKANDFIQKGLKNLTTYQTTIVPIMKKNQIPEPLLGLPLAESGYVNLEENRETTTAGLWQFIPATAANFGLVVNSTRDDRLDPILSTQAASKYLNTLYKQFGNWQLALAAYHMGENQTQELIEKYKTNNIWEIIQKDQNLTELNRYLSIVDASIIIMSHPQLVVQ